MIELQIQTHFKYITMFCCQNRDIFSIDRPTSARSVHKNDQYVQGWNPTTIFLEYCKNSIFFPEIKK